MIKMIRTKKILTVTAAMLSLLDCTVSPASAQALEPKETFTIDGFNWHGDLGIDSKGNMFFIASKENERSITFKLLDMITLSTVKEFEVSYKNLYINEYGLRPCTLNSVLNYGKDILLSQSIFNDDEKWEFIHRCGQGIMLSYLYEVVNEDGEIIGRFESDTEPHYLGRWSENGDWSAYVIDGDKFYSFVDFTSGANVQRAELQKAVGYPNPVPAGTDFTISMTSEVPAGTTLTVATIDGAVVYSAELEAGNTKAVVPASILSRGMYVYSVVAGDTPFSSGKILAE